MSRLASPSSARRMIASALLSLLLTLGSSMSSGKDRKAPDTISRASLAATLTSVPSERSMVIRLDPMLDVDSI